MGLSSWDLLGDRRAAVGVTDRTVYQCGAVGARVISIHCQPTWLCTRFMQRVTDKTAIEEISTPDRTAHDARPSERHLGAGFRHAAAGQFFRDWRVVRPFPAQGGEADVYLVVNDHGSRILKLFRYGIAPKQDVFARLVTLSEGHPDHLVRVFEFALDPGTQCYYEMEEFIADGTLVDVLGARRLADDEVMVVLRNLYTSLSILHEHNILHLDVKPANVLVRSQKPLAVVLSDFSISSLVEAEVSKKITVNKGTSLYQAPESIAGFVGPKTDWWSLGVVILELLLGRHPLAGLQPQVVLYQLTTKGLDIPDEISPRWRPLLMGLLTRNPDKRWGEPELRQWFAGVVVPTWYQEEEAQSGVAADAAGGFGAQAQARRLATPMALGPQAYHSLEELLVAAFSSFDLWEIGKTLVARGVVETWLDQNGDTERARQLRDLATGESDADLRLLTIGYYFNSALPLIWRGVPIDEPMLLGGLREYETLPEPEAQMVQGLFSGQIFNQYRKLTGNNLGRIDKLRKLGEAASATALQELPVGQRCRVVFHAAHGDFAAVAALPALEAAIGNKDGGDTILALVAAKGFSEFARRTSLWHPEDAAVWDFAGRVHASPWGSDPTVVGLILAHQDEITALARRDAVLPRFLVRLLSKLDPDHTLLKDLPDLLKAHPWLEAILRTCYRLPEQYPLGECIGSLRTTVALQARADTFKTLAVPPVMQSCARGQFVTAAEQKLVREILDDPEILRRGDLPNRFAALMKPSRCPMCQAKIRENERFCSCCGASVGDLNTAARPAAGSMPGVVTRMSDTFYRDTRAPLTLVDLVVPAMVFLLMAAIAIPGFRNAGDSAREKACYANMRVILSAIEQYNMDHSAKIDWCDGSTVNDMRNNRYLQTEPQCPLNPRGPGGSIYLGSHLKNDGVVWCPLHGTVE